MRPFLATILFMLVCQVTLAPNRAGAAETCITAGNALRLSRQLPACDPNVLPPLAFGWKWVKSYSLDDNDPYSWVWMSWPDGKNLELCQKATLHVNDREIPDKL